MRLYSRAAAGRSLLDTFAFRAISQLATALGYLVLVRAMAKEEFGAYNLLYAFIPVFSTLVSLGLEQVLRRYQPEFLGSGRPGAAAWLLRVVSAGRLATNLVVLAAILLAWQYVAPPFKLGPYREVFVGFSLLILIHFQVRILQLALSSHMLHRYSVGSTAALAMVKLALYLALYLNHSLTLVAALAIDTAAYGLAYAILRFAYRRQVPRTTEPAALSRDERRRMVRYGLLNNFNDAGVLLMYSTMDTFFIARFASVVAVGVYGFFSRLTEMASSILPVRLFDNVVQPLLFATPRAESDERIPRYFTFLLNINLTVQLPVLAFVLGFHHELVQLLSGAKYVDDSWMLPLLVAFATINVVSDPASLVAQYDEKAGILLVSKLFAVYNIAAMAVLVPVMGIYGAALASGSAQTMKNAYIWWSVRRRARWLNGLGAMLALVVVWGAAVAACLAVKTLGLPVVADLAIGAVIVAAALWVHLRGPALSSSDREILASVAPQRAGQLLQRLGLLPPHTQFSSGTPP